MGRSRPSDANDPAANTTSCSHSGAPAREATAPATAASATGPRKNNPGVRISPTASSTAAIDQAIHAATGQSLCRARQAEGGRKAVEILEPGLEAWVAAVPVDKHRAHAQGACAFDVVRDRVADHRRVGRLDVEQLEQRREDRGVGLRLAVLEGTDRRVDVERVMLRERVHVARRVGDEPDLEAGAAELVEHGERVLVELEVFVPLPAL